MSLKRVALGVLNGRTEFNSLTNIISLYLNFLKREAMPKTELREKYKKGLKYKIRRYLMTNLKFT
jgi:hypothetical protein